MKLHDLNYNIRLISHVLIRPDPHVELGKQGHYDNIMQILKDEHYLFGCAAVSYKDTEENYILVCHFGPLRKKTGPLWLNVGGPCSECPRSGKRCLEQLCGTISF